MRHRGAKEGIQATIVAFLLFALALPAAAVPASPALPLGDPAYRELEQLAAAGLLDPALRGRLPYTRLEVARQIEAARERGAAGELSAVQRETLARLAGRFREDLLALRRSARNAGASYLKPLRDLELAITRREGGASPPGGLPGGQFALDYNSEGIEIPPGWGSTLTLGGDARLGGRLLAVWRPTLVTSLEGDEDPDLRLREGYVALSAGALTVSLGRQALWWGQGRHGTLLLSNNARPLDMLRLFTPSPLLLPSLLQLLGPVQADLFVSRLESGRAVSNPYLGGLRLQAKPLPWVELGLARTVLFGGEGRPGLGAGDLLRVVGDEDWADDGDTGQAQAVIDAALRLPLPGAAGLLVYGELGGARGADNILPDFSHYGWLCGGYLSGFGPGGRLALRLEAADLTESGGDFPGWYRYPSYPAGYTRHGRPLGHHAGAPVRDLFGELEVRLGRAVAARFSLDREERRGNETEERHLQPGVELDLAFGPRLQAIAGYAYDRVENAGFDRDRDEDNHLFEVTFLGRF